MNVNITLFVQMLNFWLIFYILTRFLWRPSLQKIEQEEQEQQRLEGRIEQQKKLLANNEHRRERLWSSTRQQFARTTPYLEFLAYPPVKSKYQKVYEMPATEQQDEVQDMAKLIVESVKHV